MAKVLCIGDVMLDVVAVLQTDINYGSDTPSRISTHGGGAAGNVASWSRISGATTRIVARVGDDHAGISLLSEFEALGVEHGECAVPGAATGVVVVLVDGAGERSMFPDSGANSDLSPADLPNLSGIEVVYLSGYSLLNSRSRAGVLEIIAKIQAAEIPIFYDPATVGRMRHVELNEIRGWLPQMSVLLMNEEEATFITESRDIERALDELLKFAPTVIIKRGVDGAVGKSRNGELITVPAFATKVVDTTGAGDAFAGGFIAKWLQNPELKICMEAGAFAAAQCVAIVGARPHVTPAH